MDSASARPDWDRLYDVAAGQDGLFTAQQATAAGYSSQLLRHHVRAGRVVRVRRGIYRLVHFPAGEQEDLVAVWLWSEQEGVFSHETALALHGLSDVLPARVHLTLPTRRRLRIPAGVVLHHANVAEEERAWVGTVPVTSPARTIKDCAAAHLSPDLLLQAIEQARARGLVDKTEIIEIDLRLMGPPDDVFARLQEAGRLSLGDFMSFEVRLDPR